MKRWPFPMVRNYATNNDVTELFLRFAESENLLVVKNERFYCTVSSEHGTLKFSDSNPFYAWARDGVFTPVNGEPVEWHSEMPSRYAVRAMAKAINFKQLLEDKKFKLGA